MKRRGGRRPGAGRPYSTVKLREGDIVRTTAYNEQGEVIGASIWVLAEMIEEGHWRYELLDPQNGGAFSPVTLVAQRIGHQDDQ